LSLKRQYIGPTAPAAHELGDIWINTSQVPPCLCIRGASTWAEVGAVEGGAAAWGDITGQLSGQTDLQAALDAKAASSHNHDAAYEAKNANIQAHVVSAHAPSTAQKNSDITKAEIEAKLTGAITSHSHSGGSDPWTVIRLASAFPTTSSTAVNITGLAFTPAASKTYEFYANLMCRTATATVGPRPGCAWPTGLTDGVACVEITSAAATKVFQNGNITASVLAPVGGLPTTTGSWPSIIYGVFVSGVSPSGNFRLQLASETNGTQVQAIAGSFLRYREIA